MFGDDIVVETRLTPPRLPRRWLRRPRLDRLLANAAEYPVTVVSASAGYGKSSALASFAARGGWPVIWYSLGQTAADPLVFLLHLVHACRKLAPQAGARAVALLEQHSQGTHSWGQALDSLINDLARTLDDETILVLDDADIDDQAGHTAALIERLIEHAPARLHVLLASRHTPSLASLPILQARGELYTVGERELAFDADEIAALFEAIEGQALSVAERDAISKQTDGWPIALQLLRQGVHPWTKDERPRTKEDLGPSSLVVGPVATHELLFTYLAQEVLAGQSPEIQSFLLRSAILSELDPRICDEVLGETNSAATLRALYGRGLFLVALGDEQYRYHPLFRTFLRQHARASLPDWADLHARAAAFYSAIGHGEQALDHLLANGDSASLVSELTRQAQVWIEEGRLVTLLSWLDRLPAATLADQPQLLIARGDALRMLARFDDALAAYAEAERRSTARADPVGQSLALRGQALIYLDTVRPAPAEPLLRRAYKLLPAERREGRASLLRLIAENRLNRGRADQAARLYRVASSYSLIDDPSGPDARVFLRLGRLVEARAILEGQLLRDRATPSGGRRPEGHREPTLLLSLVCALLGEPDAALCYAREGLDAARQVGSALSEAIAHIRLGNALQLVAAPDAAAAEKHYEQAMALADAFAVPRTKAAAYLGLTLLHGFSGDLGSARTHAQAGLAIVERSGDAWTAARLWAALGAVGATYGAPETDQWLNQALRRHQACKDSYNQTVVLLYFSIWHHGAGRLEEAQRFAIETLQLARRYRYSGLLTMPTLFGPRDRMALVPILLAGRATPELRVWARELLARGFPRIAADDETQTYHPGSTLRIQLLDRLRVWRGAIEIEPRAWQRKKAPQLLALLLTNRHSWLSREQICAVLWADADPADAETQFKVTLNALNAVIEPARSPRTPPFYIRRQGSAYRFCPRDGAWLDVAEFEERTDAVRARVGAGDRSALTLEQLAGALALYRGDYLSDYLYDDWASAERERLSGRYFEAATLLAELQLEHDQPAEAVRLCESMLARDPCYEEGYQLLMRAHMRQGNRRQVRATYQRCVQSLRTQLDMAPLPQTTVLYEELLRY
ncbi:MAG TPA: BTAD domain-containing putative transcriptional regulator [Roseiflexaceae bacterium]|nr:BTAD domain-containing putative transcriptional regulator [Roseiflexaceae bacterium]